MMGTLESLATGAKDFIELTYGTYIRELDESLGIPTVSLGYKDVFAANKYPCLFLVLDYPSQDPSAAHAENVGLSLDVVIAFTASKPDVLTIRMLRYTDSFLKMLRENETFGGLCDSVSFTGGDFLQGSAQTKDIGLVVLSIRLDNEELT